MKTITFTRAFLLVVSSVLTCTASVYISADDKILRTAGGKPDFSGNYDVTTLTPFARPTKYGERQFLTPEEVAAMSDGEAAIVAAGSKPSDLSKGAPEKGGNIGAYNDFWFERGTAGFAIDGKFRTSILTDPPNGRMPERTPAGKAKADAAPRFAWDDYAPAWWLETGDTPYDGPENMVIGVRCIYQPSASLPVRSLVYNNIKTIVQTDTHVMILVEWMHWARIVRLDSEHLAPELSSLSGDSIGWWEDDTLVVETTNILLTGSQRREDGYRVVERFSPGDNGLLYQFTVHDPDYEAPYSGELPWVKTDKHNYEYACHEGNHAMPGILAGARLQEKEWREENGGSVNPK